MKCIKPRIYWITKSKDFDVHKNVYLMDNFMEWSYNKRNSKLFESFDEAYQYIYEFDTDSNVLSNKIQILPILKLNKHSYELNGQTRLDNFKDIYDLSYKRKGYSILIAYFKYIVSQIKSALWFSLRQECSMKYYEQLYV